MSGEKWWDPFDSAVKKVRQRQDEEYALSELGFARESEHWFSKREADCG